MTLDRRPWWATICLILIVTLMAGVVVAGSARILLWSLGVE